LGVTHQKKACQIRPGAFQPEELTAGPEPCSKTPLADSRKEKNKEEGRESKQKTDLPYCKKKGWKS